MELSRITVTSPHEGAESLYHKGGKEADGTLLLRSGEVADFRTYFSSLDAQLFMEKTTVRRITLRLFFDGKATVRLCRAIHTEKKAKKNRKRYTEYVACEKQGTNEVRINTDVFGGGILGITVTALEDTQIYGGVWECPDECVLRSPRLGVAVCTYKRETEVMRNAEKYAELMSDTPVDVYIVDNGGTLCAEDLPKGITLIRSRNLGGSGGFSRGMIECIKNRNSHFLLMDDDVDFDPNIIRRTAAILSVLKPEFENCSIGGAMMSFAEPNTVFENGAKLGKLRLRFPKRNIPTDVGGLLYCRDECDVNYCGWWYFCAPISALKQGLSMPFFIKYDDIEFGLRIKDVSPALYTVGIGVWHKDFSKMAAYLEYYSRRNEAITHGTLMPKGSGLRNRIRLIISYLKYCLRGREHLNYIYDGLDDYLKGPDFLLENDGEVLNDAVRKAPRKNRGFFSATGKMISLWFRLFRSRKVNKRYAEKFRELTGAESWARRLGIGDDE